MNEELETPIEEVEVPVEEPELPPVEPELVTIYVEVDTESYVTGWGSSRSNDDNLEFTVPLDHPIYTGVHGFTEYRVVDGGLVHCPDRLFKNLIEDKKIDLEEEKNLRIMSGFRYIIHGSEYNISYDQSTRELLKEWYDAVVAKTAEEVHLRLRPIDDMYLTDVILTRKEFATLYTYAQLIRQWKQDHYSKLTKALDVLTDLETILLFNWDSLPMTPVPEKPKVDLDSGSGVSQEEFDALAKQNKELQQLAEMNQGAIVELLGLMFNAMNGIT